MREQQAISISSFAAPSEADIAVWRSLTPEQRRGLLQAELEKGRDDIAAGRYTELNSDEDIRKFFDDIRAPDEAPVI